MTGVFICRRSRDWATFGNALGEIAAESSLLPAVIDDICADVGSPVSEYNEQS